MELKKLVLIGAGGHCKSVVDVVESCGNFELVGILDLKDRKGELLLGYPIFGCDDDIAALSISNHFFIITVGFIKSPRIRKEIITQLKLNKSQLASLVSQNAYVSKNAKIGKGVVIHHNAIVNAGAIIGDHSIINTGAIIEHDTIVGENCHISTKVVLNGGVITGNDCFVGSGSTVIQNIEIGNNIIVGAGSVVTKNLLSNNVYYGSPAKLKNL